MEETVVVLGTFDGVHMGHAELFRIAKEIACDNGLSVVAYTFSNHPAELFAKKQVKLLSSTAQRQHLLYEQGADLVVMDNFDMDLCSMGCEDFVQMIKSRFNPQYLVAGFNYSFGVGGTGDTKLLSRLGTTYGYKTIEVMPISYKGQVVSSSRIRHCIENGELAEANAQLGRCFQMTGKVIKGRQVGRTMGYPTANIVNEHNYPVLPFGVYATKVHLGGDLLNGVTNVGNNPTFNCDMVTVETHILDFDRDIYGEQIALDFVEFIRPQRKFSGISELVEQINKDSLRARETLGNAECKMQNAELQ